MKRILVLLGISAFVVGAFGGAASAASNGQNVGQDPIRLALTRCANSGKGNGNEVESWGGVVDTATRRVVQDDCLGHAPGSFFTTAEINAILQQSGPICRIGEFPTCVPPVTQGCEQIGSPSDTVFVCDIDPGNSANQNQGGG